MKMKLGIQILKRTGTSTEFIYEMSAFLVEMVLTERNIQSIKTAWTVIFS